MNPAARVTSILAGIALISLSFPRHASAQVYSHARVVRLSFVEGTVSLQRPDVAGWATAPANTPIQEAFKLATAQDSYAEVEFENSSTARLGELSELDFDQLQLTPNGGKINRMTLQQGYATFEFTPENDDVYEVKVGGGTLTLATNKQTRFRTDLDQGALRVEVFQGQVQVSSIFGTELLSRNMVMDVQPGAEHPVNISQGITEDDWDKWVSDRESAMSTARSRQAPGIYSANVNSLYGWSDLSSFGMWNYLPGYGYGWAPFVPAGWAPFSSGRWAWFPGWGFTWISFEPWGWLPFHFGGWIFQPGLGWCWLPDNFALWSPGVVTWFRGPGWVGWAPRRPRGSGAVPTTGVPACPSGHNCVTVVSEEGFKNGRPVGSNRLAVPAAFESFAVERPDVEPTRSSILTGTVISRPGSLSSASSAGRAQTAGASIPGTRGQAPTEVVGAPSGGRTTAAGLASGASAGRAVSSEQGVVYDPAEGRFVNGSRAAPAEAATKPATGPLIVSPTSSDSGTAPPTRLSQPAPGEDRRSAPVIDTERKGPSGGEQGSTRPQASGQQRSPSNAYSRSAPSGGRNLSTRSGGSSGWGSGGTVGGSSRGGGFSGSFGSSAGHGGSSGGTHSGTSSGGPHH